MFSWETKVILLCLWIRGTLLKLLITQIREINGEPTTTSRASSTQKFSRNKQAGRGAYIPATLLVEGPREFEQFVLEKMRSTLPECENEEDLNVECLKWINAYVPILTCSLYSEFSFDRLPHYKMAAIKKVFSFYSCPVSLDQIYLVLVLTSANHNARNRYPEMDMARTVGGGLHKDKCYFWRMSLRRRPK